MTKIVTTANFKGGSGKSMTLFQLAGILAAENDGRVLALDIDPQCNLTLNLGIDNTDLDRPSIRTIFENRDTKPEDVILTGVIDELPNLDVLPSTIMLYETDMNLYSRSNRERILENWIRRNSDYLSQYKYILCDTNPYLGPVTQNALACADAIILVTDVSTNGIQGAHLFTYLWGKCREDLLIEDNVKALILNNVDRRIGLASDIVEYIKDNEELLELYVGPYIPTRAALKNSEAQMVPLNIMEPRSDAVIAMKEIVKNLKLKGVL